MAPCTQVEAFYFSAAAGRARITLGNRRFGEGGFMAAGRQRARPVPQPRDAGKVSRLYRFLTIVLFLRLNGLQGTAEAA